MHKKNQPFWRYKVWIQLQESYLFIQQVNVEVSAQQELIQSA